MFFRRRYNRSNRFPRRRRGRVSRRPKVSKKIRTYVKKAIHKQIENKQILEVIANTAITCTGSAGTPTSRSLIPAVSPGTAAYNRIGDNIKIVKGIANVIVNLLPYNATTNPLSTPVWVKVFILRSLTSNATPAYVSSLDWGELFRGTGGFTYGLANSPTDMLSQINNDKWRLLTSRTFKLGAASATSTGQVGTGGYFDNSPMTKKISINWGKYCKKMIKINSTTGQPANMNCIIAFQCVNADGSATATQAAEYHIVNDMWFEDA